MAQAIEGRVGVCPLCGDELCLDVPDWRVSARWRDVIEHKDRWAEVAAEFRDCGSIEGAASRLSITKDVAARLLDFLCTEICGCRAVTCVSCLDDFRSEL